MIEEILQIKGLDGYIVLTKDFDVLEYNLDESSDVDGLINASRQIFINQIDLIRTQDSVLLTEKGLIMLADFNDQYLIILAGQREAVDVTRVLEAIDFFRKQSLTNL